VTPWRSVWLAVGLLAALLVGCASAPNLAGLPAAPPTPAAAQASPTATQAPTPTPGPPTDLRLWVAASLGPEARPEAWKILQRARDEFALQHGVTLELRVKPDWGPGGVPEAALWARTAAPDAAPDLILAPVDVLEAARAKRRWPPLEPAVAVGGWYPFAAQAVLDHDRPFAYPVAAEAPVLAWPASVEPPLPTTWEEWAASPVPWTWAARDPRAWSAWALYLAAGGRPGSVVSPRLVQAEPLAALLEFLVQARWNDALRTDARLWYDMNALWSGLQGEGIGLVVWSAAVVGEDGWQWGPLPGPEGPGPLMMRVYAWAVLTEDPARRDLALAWLSRVTAAGWNGPWARAAGLWPTTSAGLQQGWGAAQARAWEPWLQRAQPAPPLAVREAAAAALRRAVLQVLDGVSTPLDAAAQALLALGVPEAQATPGPTPQATP